MRWLRFWQVLRSKTRNLPVLARKWRLTQITVVPPRLTRRIGPVTVRAICVSAMSCRVPSADWRVVDAGVFWPDPADPAASVLGADGLAAGPHHLVWVDLSF